MQIKQPTIFIGSSSEGIPAAEAMQILLSAQGYQVILWSQGVFGLGKSILEELMNFLDQADFGIFILRADDLINSRGSEYYITRDNVLFELGLFIGRLGRFKTFIAYDTAVNIKIMADLNGIIYASFDGAAPNINMAVGPAVSRIKQQILEQSKPNEILYTEWHMGTKTYIERLALFKNESEIITGFRLYDEVGGQTQKFIVHGFQGKGFSWLEYHRPDKRGGGTIMLHDLGTGNYNGLITAGHCDNAALRCMKNRWVVIDHINESGAYDRTWLVDLGKILPA